MLIWDLFVGLQGHKTRFLRQWKGRDKMRKGVESVWIFCHFWVFLKELADAKPVERVLCPHFCDHRSGTTKEKPLWIWSAKLKPMLGRRSFGHSPRRIRNHVLFMLLSGVVLRLLLLRYAEDSLDSALQIREEWDLPEEKLLDLKRLQRRMSIGSLAGMQQVTVKRLSRMNVQ